MSHLMGARAASDRPCIGSARSSRVLDETNAVNDPHLDRIYAARRQFEAARQRVPAPGQAGADHFGGSSVISAPAVRPDSLPGYEIRREVHRGGQGVVYEAVQQSTNRTVAVKVLHGGAFADPRSRPRFEREVQILSQLRHPNVVTIHDSGVADGCAYFVMDFVNGRPLDRFVAGGDRAIRPTLELFAKICDAVNAAHLRGVIHRDLKPGNILVDPGGEPHVVDFGLAKVSEYDTMAADGSSAVTLSGQFVGSLPWASPEQASGDPSAIDTRTDVYALGVLLYHMLTGRFPYRVSGNMRDVLDSIMAAEPARPGAVRREIDNEVETIVLKCLAKSPERRYQSAGELARDVRNYLSGQPIEAKRDSAWYLLRKSLQRYRLATGVAAAFVLLIAGSTASLSILYRRADAEARRADGEAAAARTAQADAEAALAAELNQRRLTSIHAEQAQAGARTEKKLAEFLLDVLSTAGSGELEQDATVRDALHWAAARIDDRFADQPEMQARLHEDVGDALKDLGDFESAARHHRAAVAIRTRVLGPEHVNTLNAAMKLANVLTHLARYAEAVSALETVVDRFRSLDGPEATTTLSAMNGLALAYHELGRFDDAEQLLADVVERGRRAWGENDLSTLTTMGNLARTVCERGRHDEADALFRKVLSAQRAHYGDDHPHTIATINNLASLMLRQSQYDDALPLFEEAFERRLQTVGHAHPQTCQAMTNLGVVYERIGRLEDAECLHRDAYLAQRSELGAGHPSTLHAMCNLAHVLSEAGELDEAETLFAEATEIIERELPATHPLRAPCAGNYGRCLGLLGRCDEAENQLSSARDTAIAILGESDIRSRRVEALLVELRRACGKPDGNEERAAP